jgi:glycosyltransferase involved in cell wall biosynthesis
LISICIPAYNRDITLLINQLDAQIRQCAESINIFVLDDGSSKEILTINRNITSEYLVYGELTKNTGRAKIRNLLGRIADGEYCLFLDNDLEINKPDFLRNYASLIKLSHPAVVCGSATYPAQAYSPDRTLHWKYGTQVVGRMYSNKNKTLISLNFLIWKDILMRFPFHEELSTYGHEDTLMGYNLKKNNIEILYIDNPVHHTALDSNEEYLTKNKSALRNLLYLYSNPLTRAAVIDTPLISTYLKLKKYRLLSFTKWLYTKFHQRIQANLNSSKPSLFYFKIYKLGELIKMNSE